ncbi:unnamed protein product [Fusarium fujikuroi]|nr:unnamed protein product [Fusarium fujikuroi]
MAPTVWSAKLTQNPVAKRFHNPSSRGHRAQQPCSAIPTADVLEQNNVGFATHHRSDGRLPLLTCAAIRVSEISPPLLRWDRRTRRDKNKTGRSIGEDAFPAHDSRKAKIRHHKTGKLADVSPAPDGIPLANPADNMPASKLLLAVGTTKTAFLLFLALLKPAEPTAESLACRIGTIISKVTLRQQQGALYSRASCVSDGYQTLVATARLVGMPQPKAITFDLQGVRVPRVRLVLLCGIPSVERWPQIRVMSTEAFCYVCPYYDFIDSPPERQAILKPSTSRKSNPLAQQSLINSSDSTALVTKAQASGRKSLMAMGELGLDFDRLHYRCHYKSFLCWCSTIPIYGVMQGANILITRLDTTPALQEPRVSSIIAKSPNADSTQEAMLDHLSALDEYFQP